MNVTATLFGQMITFIVFVWFIKAYLWEPLTQAMESRTKKISDGLAAAEQGQKNRTSDDRILYVLIKQRHRLHLSLQTLNQNQKIS